MSLRTIPPPPPPAGAPLRGDVTYDCLVGASSSRPADTRAFTNVDDDRRSVGVAAVRAAGPGRADLLVVSGAVARQRRAPLA